LTDAEQSTLSDMSVTYDEIEEEFEYSLGYIHNDIQALCQGQKKLNYTVALLVGVACEALEDAGAYANKITVLGDLLPDADWKKLAKPLFDALRHGLAHKFDTKHIHVNGNVVQIYLSWTLPKTICIEQVNGKDALRISTCRLGNGVCEKIRDFRTKLQNDADARKRFKNALDYGHTVDCAPQLWDVLKNKT
jgi:hypothetical protein